MPGLAAKALTAACLLAGTCILAAAAHAATIGWQPVGSPLQRRSAAVAYDSVRGQTVLFGGGTETIDFGDTWVWDGAWRQVATNGPDPRSGAVMAYDVARNRIVLFSGERRFGGYKLFGDTWEWDGNSWTQVASTGPDTKGPPGMAYDCVRQKVILFNGLQSKGPVSDTWEWDGVAWTRIATSGPPPRIHPAMACDSQRGKVVLFGGFNTRTNTYYGDTWEWDGNAWTQIATAGPSARFTSMAYDSIRGKTVMFGGHLNDPATWEWDGNSWSQVAASGPAPRGYQAVAYDAARRTLVVFGGWSYSGFFGDTWTWDGSEWTEAVVQPDPREGASMAFDSIRGKIVLFGGCGTTYKCDTWEWDGRSWRALDATGPSPRIGAGFAFDEKRRRIILFGGSTGSGFAQDTWEWDGAAWSQVASAGPDPRCDYAIAYDSARARVILFGGYTADDTSVFFSDTWEWDGSEWKQVASTGPGPRRGASMDFDSSRGRCVLFGGYFDDGTGGAFVYYGDTWEWDGNSWRQVATTGPSPRHNGSMAFDSARGLSVLFGGARSGDDNAYPEETQEWDGASWHQALTAGPGARSAACMAFDSARGEVILFGGHSGTGVVDCGDTWRYGPVSVPPQPFTLNEAVRALQCAAGLITLSEVERDRCDVETNSTSSGCVDIVDACRIARKVTGLEANP